MYMTVYLTKRLYARCATPHDASAVRAVDITQQAG